jgi:hypothetical protein
MIHTSTQLRSCHAPRASVNRILIKHALVQLASPKSAPFHAAGLPVFSISTRDAQSESALGTSGPSSFTVFSAVRPRFNCFC